MRNPFFKDSPRLKRALNFLFAALVVGSLALYIAQDVLGHALVPPTQLHRLLLGALGAYSLYHALSSGHLRLREYTLFIAALALLLLVFVPWASSLRLLFIGAAVLVIVVMLIIPPSKK